VKYRKSNELEVPHGNSAVWRYMNTWKFEQFIEHSTLFFPNANKLTDEYEVTLPASVEKEKRAELERQGLYGQHLEEAMASYSLSTNPMKELVLINCWSASPHESYALWKIYLGGEKDGIAIRSTVSKLRRSIEKGEDEYPEEFFIGKVKYKKNLMAQFRLMRSMLGVVSKLIAMSYSMKFIYPHSLLKSIAAKLINYLMGTN